jgi:hypothetical protein
MSPEQALGEPATPKSDLYSLGVVLYEMLTGELPYDAETPAGVVMKHVGGLSRSAREINPEVPEELDAVSARLLSRDPDDRYPDANALVEELERVKEGLPLTEETMRARTRVRRAGRLRRRGVLVALALVLVSIGLIAAVALGQGVGPFAEPSTLPKEGPLEPGKYRSDEFEPALSFRVGEGWVAPAPEVPDALGIALAGTLNQTEPLSLSFFGPNQVIDPKDPAETTVLAAPEDPKTEELVRVSVGGISGKRVDMTAEHTTGLWQLSDQSVVNLTKGARRRIIVLDVRGETVLISILAPSPDRFEEFLPKAQDVLDTVEWEVSS